MNQLLHRGVTYSVETKILEYESSTKISFVNRVDGGEERTYVVCGVSNATRETSSKLGVGLNNSLDLKERGSANTLEVRKQKRSLTVIHQLFNSFEVTFQQVSLLFFVIKTMRVFMSVLVVTRMNDITITHRFGVDLEEMKPMLLVVGKHVVLTV